MKNLVLLVIVGFVAIFATGCGTPMANIPMGAGGGSYIWGSSPGYRSPTDPILQSSLPADPVPRSEEWFRNWDGSVNYYHSQGTHNSVSRSWTAYGPQDHVSQSTHNTTSLNITPSPRYIAPVVNVYVPPPSYGNGVSRQKPCKDAAPKMVPYTD